MTFHLPERPATRIVERECCSFCNPGNLADHETKCLQTTVNHGRKAFLCRDCLHTFVLAFAEDQHENEAQALLPHTGVRLRQYPNPPGQMTYDRFCQLRFTATRWRNEWMHAPNDKLSKHEASQTLDEALNELCRILAPYLELAP